MYIVEIFSYDVKSGLRFRDEWQVDSLRSAQTKIFWEKLRTDVAGWKIYEHIKHEDFLVRSGWDRRARKQWATGEDATN